MMTKKHFENVARIIRERREVYAESEYCDEFEKSMASMVTHHLANDMADYFRFENPNFDRERFLTACGIGR